MSTVVVRRAVQRTSRKEKQAVSQLSAPCRMLHLPEEQNASEGLKFMANWLNKNAPQLKAAVV